MNQKMSRPSFIIFVLSTLLFAATVVIFSYILHNRHLINSPAYAQNGDISWRVFDGGVDDPGANTSETTITTSNVANLSKLWEASLPATADNAVIEEPNVQTASGPMDLVFVNTIKGNLMAFNTITGAKIWEADPSSALFNGQGTKSTPAIDPSGNYIYAYAVDGNIHKYNITNGVEVAGNGFPAQVTLLPNDTEKGSASLNIANGYLYMTLSGNDGDYGHYDGHVVAINLSTGTKTVWNSLCSDITQLLDANSSSGHYCSSTGSGIWARPGVKVDPVTGNVFVVTGNGNYNACISTCGSGNNWGDSIIELKPDLSQIVDSYTPSTYSNLDSADADLGSTAPVILPMQAGSNTPYMLVQGGKDSKIRLLDRTNLSGQGGPRHVTPANGELQNISISGEVHEQPAVWVDGSGNTWVYVTDDTGDLYAYRVVTSGGVSSLTQVYTKSIGVSSSPFVANGVLYLDGNNILALNATTGATLFNSSSIGIGLNQHWESPTVVNGILFTSDNNGNLIALYVPGSISTAYPSTYGFYTNATTQTVNWSGNFVSSWGAGRLDAFTLGNVSNNIQSANHIWYGDNWYPWEALPLGFQMSTWPSAVSWGPNRIDVFGRANSGAPIHAFNDANGWHNWETFGGCITGAPAVSSWGLNRLDVFAQGCGDNGGSLNYFYFDGAWHPWQTLPNSQQITSAPAAVSWGVNRIDVFARGTAGQLLHRFLDANGWHNWESLGGCITGAPGVSSWGLNRLDVFAQGCGDNGNNLNHLWFNGAWQPWETLPNSKQITASPAAVSWGVNRIDVFARDPVGGVRHRYFDTGGWHNWE